MSIYEFTRLQIDKLTSSVDALGPLVGTDDVRAVWESLDRARAVLDVLMTVTLHPPPGTGRRTFAPDSVEITWRVP